MIILSYKVAVVAGLAPAGWLSGTIRLVLFVASDPAGASPATTGTRGRLKSRPDCRLQQIPHNQCLRTPAGSNET